MACRNLFVSDVDNTLLGDDDATRRFAEWVAQRRGELRIAYNSGRFVESVLESVNQTDLPLPDAVIGGVGTRIYFPDTKLYLPDWPKVEGWDASAIRRCLCEFADLEPQPDRLQSLHKVSYFAYDLSASRLETIIASLLRQDLQVKVVYSSGRDLDVLPAGAGKGAATARLAEFWDFPRAETIVAGDSGNDLAMFQRGFRGIVVGNAHAELKALNTTNTFHAVGDYADGVVEGLTHWMDGP